MYARVFTMPRMVAETRPSARTHPAIQVFLRILKPFEGRIARVRERKAHCMNDLTPEQLHWLRLLKEHHPKDGSEIPIPSSVSEVLLDLRLAHRRPGSAAIEITFDGVQEVLRRRLTGSR
jgi:hypothetical protein